MTFFRVFGGEFRKLKRSIAPWATLGAWLFMGSMAAFVLWIATNPGMAARLGLIGAKGNFLGAGFASDWASLLTLSEQIANMGGAILYSLIVAWTFGREYAEGTAKNMLALPIPRAYFALAKTIVTAIWLAGLLAVLVAETLALGFAFGLPGFSWPAFLAWMQRIGVIGLLVASLGPAVSFAAVAGKGYMAPLGYTLLTLVLGSVLGHTGWARWCPWSIVGLYSGATGPIASDLGTGSFAVLGAFFALGLAATAWWQAKADNAQ